MIDFKNRFWDFWLARSQSSSSFFEQKRLDDQQEVELSVLKEGGNHLSQFPPKKIAKQ